MMKFKNIRLINFRNYNNICLDFNDKINVFIGDNAQGKTNLMEAIYMCSRGRSFRTNRDKEIINYNKNEAYIGANLEIDSLNKFLEIKMDRSRPKRIRINKNELENYRDLNSGISVIVFTPERLKIVKDGPQERRNFINEGISQIRPVYNYNLSKYNKILYQRNNLLKSSRYKKDIGKLLDVFDLQIIKIGTDLILERKKYIENLGIEGKDIYENISGDLEKFEIQYISNLGHFGNREEIEKKYYELLKENIKRDMEYGTTEIGPHRDDLLIKINDRDVRIFGSQGQQRSVVLSLILSELNIIKKERGYCPILILDDVFSELDEGRRGYLINLFKDLQVFITSANYEDLKALEKDLKKVFTIKDGKLEF